MMGPKSNSAAGARSQQSIFCTGGRSILSGALKKVTMEAR
jgi:hypothetical protein